MQTSAPSRVSTHGPLLAVPVNRLPGRGVGTARQHGHMVAVLLKGARQHLAHLSAAAGQHDAQRTRAERLDFIMDSGTAGGGERRTLGAGGHDGGIGGIAA